MTADKSMQFPRSAIFEGIPEDKVAALCAQGDVVSVKAGHVLFERGQSAEELFVLQEGAVELLFPVVILGVARDVTMETKDAGDVVAWSSLVSPYRLTLGARCASDAALVRLKRDALFGFFETNPDTGYRFMRNLAGVIGRRLQAMQTIWMRELQAGATRRLE